jgi:small GTP-binding protein
MTTLQKKICLLGEFAVGKTSLVRRFVEGRFEDKYLSTIGVKVSRRTLNRAYGELNLLVWDLAGSDDFNAQSPYLRGAMGAVVVCDLTRYETLAGLARYGEIMRSINSKAGLVFVGNKCDLTAEHKITTADLSNASQPFQAAHLLSSAKTGENVEAAFLKLAEQIDA